MFCLLVCLFDFFPSVMIGWDVPVLFTTLQGMGRGADPGWGQTFISVVIRKEFLPRLETTTGNLKNLTQERVKILYLWTLQPINTMQLKKKRSARTELPTFRNYHLWEISACWNKSGSCLYRLCEDGICTFPSSIWTWTKSMPWACKGSEYKIVRIIYNLLQPVEIL